MRSVLALSFALSLSACGSSGDAPEAPAATPGTEATADTPEASGDAPILNGSDEEATDTPTGPNEAQLDADAAADAAAQAEIVPGEPDREPYHADLIVGDWTIAVGPAESVTFATDGTRGSGTARFYINDRLSESGTFSVEGTELIVTTSGAAGGTYQLVNKEADALAYTGGDNAVADEATMLLSRIPGE